MKIIKSNLARCLPSGRQGGFIAVLALVGSLIVISLIYTGISYEVSRKSEVISDADKDEYVKESKEKIERYYQQNMLFIDSSPALLYPTQTAAAREDSLLNAANVTKLYGARLDSSTRLDKNGIKHHMLAFWLPPDGVQPVFDTATGQFNAGYDPKLKFALINGYLIESKAKTQTLDKMRSQATALETWFSGVNVQNTTVQNWFKDPDCLAVPVVTDYLPCSISTGSPIANLTPATTLFADGSQGQTVWGNDINYINDTTIVANTRPYSLMVTTTTPWGEQLSVMAVEPDTTNQ